MMRKKEFKLKDGHVCRGRRGTKRFRDKVVVDVPRTDGRTVRRIRHLAEVKSVRDLPEHRTP